MSEFIVDAIRRVWRKKGVAVFSDVEDVASFVPSTEMTSQTFVLWSAEAWARWESTGVLAGHWGGTLEWVAMGFALSGGAARVDVEARASEAAPDSVSARLLGAHKTLGTFVLSRTGGTSDLLRLIEAFEWLSDEGDVLALPCVAYAYSDAWDAVAQRQRSPKQTAVFWVEPAHRAFDACGNLVHALDLDWRGKADVIVSALRRAGLTAEAPSRGNIPISVMGKLPPIVIPSFDAVCTEARPGTQSQAAATGQRVGEWSVSARITAPELRPIQALGLRSDEAVIGYGYDARGWPKFAGLVLALSSGEVLRSLSAVSGGGSIRNLEVLADGRVLLGLQDFVSPSDEHPVVSAPLAATPGAPSGEASAVVVRTLDADGDHLHRIHCFVHGPAVRVVDVAADGITAAVWTRDGAQLFTLDREGPGTRVGSLDGAPGAYPVIALSPDAACVALGTSGDTTIVICERSTGDEVELEPFEGLSLTGGRGFTHFFFEPQGRALVIGVRTEQGDQLRFFDIATGERIWLALSAQTHGQTAAAISPDGALLAIGRKDGTIALYDVVEAVALGVGEVFRGPVTVLSFSRDGRLAAGSQHGEVAVLTRG